MPDDLECMTNGKRTIFKPFEQYFFTQEIIIVFLQRDKI